VIRKWVINASPLIILGKVSEISLINKMCSDLVIPEGVAQELDQGPVNDQAKVWINGEGACFVRPLGEAYPLIMAWDLGKGETEVISWAYLNHDYEAILDDRAARNCASSLGIRVRGTLGVILLAKKERILPGVRPLLDKLMESGFRIDPRLLRSVYQLANEDQ
jgi:predicted nucleic acid-binding protein